MTLGELIDALTKAGVPATAELRIRDGYDDNPVDAWEYTVTSDGPPQVVLS